MIETTAKKRVLSGMRPTGKLHLGNYMGALKNWVGLQNDYECFFFVADLHALTTDYADPSRIKQNTVDVALDFLAAGLDPEKCTIFIQSHVAQHAELHLLFSMITPLGWLERVPSYKDQQDNIKGKDLATYGFLGYPLLQSADILLYQPDYVPVGADQVAHVELTREVARRFNSTYKTKIFPEPEALLTPTPKLPGIDGRKMSKSYGNTIGLSDSPLTAVAKIRSMSTNGQRLNQADPGDPDRCPVGDLHKVFSPLAVIEETQSGCRSAAMPCEYCKGLAALPVIDTVHPIFVRRMELESKIEQTWEMLLAQGEKAAKRAEETMLPVRAALDITRELGAARRFVGYSEADRDKLRDLSERTDLWTLPLDLRGKQLREYWRRNLVPSDVQLSQEPNRVFSSIARELQEPFLTRKKKRVVVLAPTQFSDAGTWWRFPIPVKPQNDRAARTYEVWVLLIWQPDRKRLQDFIVPQRFFAHKLAQLANEPHAGFEIAVTRNGETYSMQIGSDPTPIDITALHANYDPLS